LIINERQLLFRWHTSVRRGWTVEVYETPLWLHCSHDRQR